ncbi:DUF3334 family protein [Enterovibrio nigricans]|uniref:Chemotaxis protein CheX n=1 Tax=Enterovibrio nigricans DSM 22720 TaxID=1121868 RepID=A0A1T4UL58_9GAMM|nr:DUF3334 family protein [Enterovibrio nigricans]SKA53414.1 Protein of unknown function [Enterovibrio nigricans DSM 22720]
MRKTKIVTSEDILLKLCQSVTGVLSKATDTSIHHSAMVQKITKTSLKPDFGCFVLFDGGFSGLVVINFEAKAALEVYQKYMSHMGIPAEELATLHTSDEVADVLGELMNQIVGDFTGKVRRSLHTNITQNQPKMMAINKNINVTVDSNIDRPQARRVSFSTENNNIFYLELSMERTEFIQLEEFEEGDEVNPDSILETEVAKQNDGNSAKSPANASTSLTDDLGI